MWGAPKSIHLVIARLYVEMTPPDWLTYTSVAVFGVCLSNCSAFLSLSARQCNLQRLVGLAIQLPNSSARPPVLLPPPVLLGKLS